MPARVLRSFKGKGKAREHGTKGMVMGPVRDWGRKTVIVSGGTQYTLDGCTDWKNMGKFAKLEPALGKAADEGAKMFEKNDGAIHQLWLDMEGGEAMEIMAEAVNDCASELAHLIAQGVVMQEAENKEVEVMREVMGTEIRDII